MGKKSKHRINSIEVYSNLFESIITSIENTESELKRCTKQLQKAIKKYSQSEESESESQLNIVKQRSENVRSEIENFLNNIKESHRLCTEFQSAIREANKFYIEKSLKPLKRFSSKEAVKDAIEEGCKKYKDLHKRLVPFDEGKPFFNSLKSAQKEIEPFISSFPICLLNE